MIGGAVGFIAGNRWALAAAKWVTIAVTILLLLLSIRRGGERAGRIVERLEGMEMTNEIQRQMLDAAAHRPRDRDEPTDRLRDGRF